VHIVADYWRKQLCIFVNRIIDRNYYRPLYGCYWVRWAMTAAAALSGMLRNNGNDVANRCKRIATIVHSRSVRLLRAASSSSSSSCLVVSAAAAPRWWPWICPFHLSWWAAGWQVWSDRRTTRECRTVLVSQWPQCLRHTNSHRETHSIHSERNCLAVRLTSSARARGRSL